MAKTVLCYGDSLTWGLDPATYGRHVVEHRWPNALQTALGKTIHTVEEGLCGRTTAYEDFTGSEDRNGVRALPILLGSHQPLDLVIMMLGTNDLKHYVAGSAVAASMGMRRLIGLVRNHLYFDGHPPEILLVSPPHIIETNNPQTAARFAGGVMESLKLALYYADLADEMECNFFDAASVAKASPIDGVHLDAENTISIGKGLAPMVRLLLGL